MWVLEGKTDLDDRQAYYVKRYKNMQLEVKKKLLLPRGVIHVRSANTTAQQNWTFGCFINIFHQDVPNYVTGF